MDIDETPRPGEAPDAYVERLAREKAAERAAEGELVLAADTTVTLNGRILGKPNDPEDARAMLRELAGREHQVMTGVALHAPGIEVPTVAAVDVSTVRFAPMSEAEIAWYVDTGEPLDKAGAYGIQGRGALFITSLEGSFSNVVGLPLRRLYELLRQCGWEQRLRTGTPAA